MRVGDFPSFFFVERPPSQISMMHHPFCIINIPLDRVFKMNISLYSPNVHVSMKIEEILGGKGFPIDREAAKLTRVGGVRLKWKMTSKSCRVFLI